LWPNKGELPRLPRLLCRNGCMFGDAPEAAGDAPEAAGAAAGFWTSFQPDALPPLPAMLLSFSRKKLPR
jgi:hypothetical protein